MARLARARPRRRGLAEALTGSRSRWIGPGSGAAPRPFTLVLAPDSLAARPPDPRSGAGWGAGRRLSRGPHDHRPGRLPRSAADPATRAGPPGAAPGVPYPASALVRRGLCRLGLGRSEPRRVAGAQSRGGRAGGFRRLPSWMAMLAGSPGTADWRTPWRPRPWPNGAAAPAGGLERLLARLRSGRGFRVGHGRHHRPHPRSFRRGVAAVRSSAATAW